MIKVLMIVSRSLTQHIDITLAPSGHRVDIRVSLACT